MGVYPEQESTLVARELDKVSLPTYRIEPPDVLTIEVQRLVPRTPYRLRPMDALQITVEGTLPDQPINGTFIVDPGGMIALGPGYGKAVIGNLPLEEASDAIESHLRRYLREPQVSLTLAEAAGLQSVQGEHTVGPDGTISLGIYGRVQLTGLTLDEARQVINQQLEKKLDRPNAAISVFSYSSKKYYCVIAGAGNGDTIQSFPVTGNETVLDAIALVNGITGASNRKIWIARPAPNGVGCEQILPVDYEAVVKGGNASTNYQIFPGDRIYFEDDKMFYFANRMQRVMDPFTRIFNFMLLGTNAIQLGNRYPDGFNNN